MAKRKTDNLEEPIKDEFGNLSERHEALVREYLIHNNATKAYLKTYPDSSEESARRSGSRLLTNVDIKERIEHLLTNLEEAAEVSRLRVLKEFMNIGFSSLGDFQKDWFTKKEFDKLTEVQKSVIAEIRTETIIIDENVSKEVIKFKLHDKQKALENIAKILGYYEQTELTKDLSININIIKPEE